MTLQETNLNIPEKEYHDNPALSYSILSRYDRDGYESLLTLDKPVSSPSLTFGSLVDCLITQPEEEFNNRYVVATLPVLSETVIAIMNTLINQCVEKHFIMVQDEVILSVLNQFNYCSNYKDATRITKIREQGTLYYNVKKSSEDKEIISVELLKTAQDCVEALRNSTLTGMYFSDNNPFSMEKIYQLQLLGTEDENQIPIKAMLDLVMIDHENKKIYPCDLKTSKSIYTFEESFYKYRYYIQAELYTYLLSKTIKEKCPELQDYAIQPYRFIVIDRTIFKPIVFEWTIPDKVIDLSGKERKNWKTLLKEVMWCLAHMDLQLPKDWYEDLQQDAVIHLKHY